MFETTPPAEPPVLITRSHAARLAWVGEGTIAQWAKTGRLRVTARLATGARLFRAADVLEAAKPRPRRPRRDVDPVTKKRIGRTR